MIREIAFHALVALASIAVVVCPILYAIGHVRQERYREHIRHGGEP